MMPLETRIESAAAAAAAEIAPADIPELRLPLGRNRRAWRADPGAPGDRRRWLAPLAAAVSVAAVVTFLVILGHAPLAGRGGTGPGSAATTAQRLLAKEALDAYFPATGAQYAAGLAFAWSREKIVASRTGTCMAKAGFPEPPFSWARRNFVLHFADRSRFPDLVRSQEIRAIMSGTLGASRLPTFAARKSHLPGDAAAFRHCLALHASRMFRLDKLTAPLSASWLKEVGRIQSSAPVRAKRAEFAHCLEAAGVPAGYAKPAVSYGSGLFAGYFAWMDALRRASVGHRQLASAERSWAPVFIGCARSAVATMERIQLAARQKFLRAHAGQIGAITSIVIELPQGGRT